MIQFQSHTENQTGADTRPDMAAHLAALDATERLGDEIAELAAHLHAATYRLLTLLRDFDARDGWCGGFRSWAHWLSWRTGVGLGPAREKVRVARALGSLPRISAAMQRGALSYSKVRALTRVASPSNETELMEFALCGSASQVERLVRAWRRVDRLEEAEAEQARHESRHLSLYPDIDGTYVLRGRLDPEVGALLVEALEAATEQLYGRKVSADTSAGQRRADTIGLVAERSLHTDADGVRRADRFQVVLHTDAERLAEESEAGQSVLAESGHRVAAETSRRISCDASLVEVRHDSGGGGVLDVGRRRRTVPPAIRRALEHRDRVCSFPGCENRFCDAHHVRHWADGGETKLKNLTLICRVHHRAVHEDGYRVELDDEGAVRFRDPWGRLIADAPAAPRVGPNPVAMLRGDNGADGVAKGAGVETAPDIDEWTAAPAAPAGWDTRLDLDWAIMALRG